MYKKLKWVWSLNIKLPLIGNVLLWELLLILVLMILTIFFTVITLALAPMFHGVFMPGSGGGAQMIVLTFIGPIFLLSIALAVISFVYSIIFLRKTYIRSKS